MHPAPLDQTISARYRILSELGRGGMGVVYRALDETLNREVALKLLSNARMTPEGRARMLQEAQTAAGLHHPNIVVVHDAGEYDGAPFIVMELVEGSTLYDARPEDYPGIIEAAAQVCRALEHAHARGIVHRDLKPENVVREASGNLKLMDFGLARSTASRLTEDGAVMGTVFYMAPEQVTGSEVDGRTDLYALGVMLYEFITGTQPFHAENPVAVLTQHLTAPVVPPIARRAGCPQRLNDLVLGLLAKDMADRPASAADVLAALEDPTFLTGPEAAPETAVSGLDRIARGHMVGRGTEAETAGRLWKEVLDGRGETLLISGEPGIGKSRLVRELMTRVEVGGGLVLFGAAFEEGGVPYDIFRQMLRGVMRTQKVKRLSVPPETLQVLLGLAPDLRDSYPDLDAVPGGTPEQAELFEHLTIFLNLVSAHHPLLLVLDDVHWADSGSLSLMRHVARSTRQARVMLAATYREMELDSVRPLHEVLLDLGRNRIGVRVKLLRLDREKTRGMLFHLFNQEITDDLLDGIYRETEGNPFFIEEVCRALVDSGRLFYEDGVWHRPSIAELGIPQGVRVAIQSRFHRLSEDVQEIIGQAAVIGREFGYDTLADASGAGENELIEALEDAERAQLIEEIKGPETANFRFLHALIPTSIVEGLRTLKQRSLFRRAAGAVERRYPDRVEVLANYFLRAGESARAVEYLVRVGDRARLAYANREAIEAYRQAAEYLEDQGDLGGAAVVQMKLGLACQQAFDFEAANQAQQQAFRLWGLAAADAPGAAPEPDRELHLVYKGEVVSFDPNLISDQFSNYVCLHLFDRLVAVNAEASILPEAARSWEVLDGGRRYVFRLREGAAWSDGVPVTAADFVLAFQRQLEAGQQSPIRASHPVGEHVLEIELSAPAGDFLHWLATHGAPVPRHAFERFGERWTDPENLVGNGMFTIESYEPGRRLILARTPHAHARTPSNLARIHWDLAAGEAEALERYRRGDIDLFYSNGLSQETRRSIRMGSLAAEYFSQPGLNTVFLEFNLSIAPFDDQRVRLALALAMDLEAYGRTNPGGFDIAVGGLIPPGMAGYTPGIHQPHDPEKARRLLAEAGYPGGSGFPRLRGRMFQWGDLGSLDIFTRQWRAELGLQLDWEVISFGEFLSRRWDGEWDIRLFGWYADTVDPGNILFDFNWYELGAGKRWENEEFYALRTQIRETLDQDARIALARRVDQMIAEEVPFVPICHARNGVLISERVKGFPLSASTPFDLRNIRVT